MKPARRVSMWLLCICGIIPFPHQAQHESFSFEHYNYKDGISGPVNKIAQDSFGFIWLGTMDGLARFDGRQFLHFRHDPSNPATISNNIVNDLCVDRSNRVWAATNGGLCYYDYADGMWHRVRVDYSMEPIDRHRVHTVTTDAAGRIWFSTKTALHQGSASASSHIITLPQEGDLTIKHIFSSDETTVIVGTNFGLHVVNVQDRMIRHHEVTSGFIREKGLQATVHPIVPFDGDTMLIGSWYGGLQKLILSDGVPQTIPCPDSPEPNPRKHVVKAVCQAGPYEWWVGTYGNGLSVYSSIFNRFTHHFHHDPQSAESLGDEYINDIMVDRSGITWIGTSKGLDKLDPITRQFTSIPIPASSEEFSVYRLPADIVLDRQQPGWLWIPVPGAGLYHWHTGTNRFELFQHQPGQQGTLPDNAVYTVYQDDMGQVWIGMRSGLCLFDHATKTFRPAPLPPAAPFGSVHVILQDDRRQFWFGTHSHGVVRYDRATGVMTQYQYDAGELHDLPDNRIFCLEADQRGRIWIGTQNRGLIRLDPVSGTKTHFEHSDEDATSIPDNGIYDIYEDPSGTIWVTTENGIAKMMNDGAHFTSFSTMDGLPHNTVYSMAPDDEGFFWLATNNGLSRFSPRNQQFKNYYINDGLPHASLSAAVFIPGEGRLYLASPGMITYCLPDQMQINPRIPPVVITSFRIFDQEVPLQREGEALKPITLSYRQNMITFHFAALHFTHPGRNQYAYRLDGFDEGWNDAGHTPSATYTNLDGGKYTFRVKASNHDGVWNEEGASVLIIVRPPFWLTWWFITIAGMFFLALIYGIYRVRVAQIMKLQEIRSRISRDLHDDIGSTLSSINMLSSMAAHQGPPSPKAADIMQTISSASRQAMDLMSDIVWSVNPMNDRLENIVIRMRQYASEILEAAHIGFRLDFDPAMGHILLPADKRKDFYLIFKEALNNLAKYSGAQQALISIAYSHRTVTLQVSDDGKGFDMAQSFHGNGLKNMQARAKQLGGHLNLESSPGHGTRLFLEFPVTPY